MSGPLTLDHASPIPRAFPYVSLASTTISNVSPAIASRGAVSTIPCISGSVVVVEIELVVGQITVERLAVVGAGSKSTAILYANRRW